MVLLCQILIRLQQCIQYCKYDHRQNVQVKKNTPTGKNVDGPNAKIIKAIWIQGRMDETPTGTTGRVDDENKALNRKTHRTERRPLGSYSSLGLSILIKKHH